MAGVGALRLQLLLDDSSIIGVEVTSTRPQVYQLLHGKTPENVIKLVPALFSLCGMAQTAVAEAAIAAASNKAFVRRSALEFSIACEAIQEHCWRLLLDWPKALGLTQLQVDFIRWHGMLREIGVAQGELVTLKHEIESFWLGMPAKEWLQISELSDLEHWWSNAHSPAGKLFAMLAKIEIEEESVKSLEVPLLPDWTALQAQSSCASMLNAEFVARPTWKVAPAETGALAYYTEASMLHHAMQSRQSRVLARVLARVYDMLQMLSGNFVGRLDYVGSHGTGFAIAKTARGILMHKVLINADLVQDYWVVAPTEWNFHPAGSLTAGLIGKKGDVKQLLQTVKRHVLSLDPCVEYELEVVYA